MKKLIIISFTCFLLLNVASKFIFTNYDLFNLILSSFSFLSSGVLLFFLVTGNINDAYKIGLTFLYLILLILKFVISILSPSSIENNYYLLSLLLIIIFEFIFLLVVKYMKKHV